MRTYTDYGPPQPHPTRAGWVGHTFPDGSGIGWPAGGKPSIQPNHIDGPLLHFSDGQLHWLTLWERLLFALGRTDADKLERKRRPNLRRCADHQSHAGL